MPTKSPSEAPYQTLSRNQQRPSTCLSCHISAAFDTISHTILLDRLETCFGITGSVLKWVESYLTNRSQFVKIGGSASQDTFLSAGVPQGSVLGPLLFCSYVSSLQTVVPDGILFHQYADDTQLYCSVSTNNFLADVGALQNCTDVIEYWFLTNEMLLNADKSDALLVSTSQQANKLQPDARVMVAGTSVALSDSVRSLGVVIDKHLSMEKHINSVLRSCCFHIKALRHIRRSLTDEVANTVARCIVLSRIDYCNSLLYGAPSQYLNKLQRVQNSLARIVLNKPFRSPAAPLLRELHWLPVTQRVRFKIASLVFRCRDGSAPSYLSELISEKVFVRGLRSAGTFLLEEPRTRTVVASRAFSSAGPRIWNSLDVETRKQKSFDTFKKKLKTFLFSNI